MEIVRLFARNLGLTAAGIVVCVLIGLPIGYVVASMREPGAARYVSSQARNVSALELDRFYQTRDSIIWFAAWCGLISAQTVFATWHFGGREMSSSPVGAFPVKELT